MSNAKDIDLDSFFSDFKNDLDKKVEENNAKIASQIKEVKDKALKEMEESDIGNATPVDEVVVEQEKAGDIKPIIVDLPAIYNSSDKSLSEDEYVTDHLTQHGGF
jgi:tryptophanyl-tRNA synthetase